MIKNITLITFVGFGIIACSAPIPNIVHEEQRITSIKTVELNKIKAFALKLENLNAKTIYMYVENDGAVRESGTGAGELPKSMRRQVKSILMDFSPKVRVVDSSGDLAKIVANDKSAMDRIYTLNGAITMYDKDVMSQGSGIDFGLDFGKGDGAGSSDTSFKDKDSVSILGMDFYLKKLNTSYIVHKNSSKINLKTTTRGYSFGIFINDGGVGVSGAKTIRDGAGLSVRKLLQESMYNLIQQIYQ